MQIAHLRRNAPEACTSPATAEGRGACGRTPPASSVADADRERCLRRCEAGDGDAIRRHADVVQADLLEEVDRRRIAAVLAADAELQVRARAAALLDRDVDQLADADRVERLERVLVEDLLLLIDPEELA